MIRTSPLRLLSIVAVCLALTSCASYDASHAPERSPVEQAKLQYTALSLDYAFVMQSLEDAGKIHPFTHRQRDILNSIQRKAQEWHPLVRTSLDAWAQFGLKPANYDATLAHITEALNEAKAISEEIKVSQ